MAARKLRAARMAKLAALAALMGAAGWAQTTTTSGTVYDPRTTASALPLPGVLVYATTSAVAPLPAGVQCLTYQNPPSAASYTKTAVDGTFTLEKVPENTDYTVVIQAGKRRRQFAVQVGTAPVTGLKLHMPANHTEGDIPLIAIATGTADGVECVLRDMGISDAEFTDDTGTVNPGGRIHLYQGSGAGGEYITPSTPIRDRAYGKYDDAERLRHGDVPLPGQRLDWICEDDERAEQHHGLCQRGRARIYHALQFCVAGPGRGLSIRRFRRWQTGIPTRIIPLRIRGLRR